MLAFASAEPFIRAAPVQDVWYANNVTEYKIVISADTSVPEGVAIAGARVRYEIPVAYPYVLTLKRVELRPSGDIFNGINSLDVLDSSNLSFNRRALSGTINNRTGNLAFLWFTLDLDYHGALFMIEVLSWTWRTQTLFLSLLIIIRHLIMLGLNLFLLLLLSLGFLTCLALEDIACL